MSLLKLIWMNYGWLDPLGRVRRQPHWCNHFRVDGQFGSDLEKSSPRWRIVGRGRKSRKSTNDSEIQILKFSSSSRSSSTVDRPVDRSKGISSNSRRTVDRSGRPSAEAAERSTGPVDRRAQHAQQTCTGYCGRPARSTD